MKLFTHIALASATLGLPMTAVFAAPQNAPKPLISKARAETIAMSTAEGGKVVSSEYENEGGAWRWSFDIRQNGKIHEIGVDGRTGRVVENSWEDPASEAHEAD